MNHKKTCWKVLVFMAVLVFGMLVPQAEKAFGAAKAPKLSASKITIKAGKTKTLTVKNTNAAVKWSTSKKKVATVSAKGKVTAKTAGKAVITASVSGKKLKCTVTVKAVLNKTKAELSIGSKLKLKVTGASSTVKWTTSNKKTATVTKKGVVTAKQAGTAKIIAQFGQTKLVCTVKVVKNTDSSDTGYTFTENGTVLFGSYEQDNDTANGKEPIEWIVLEKQADRMMLISKYGLECKSYDSIDKLTTTWESCTLRAWLNSTFLNTSFTSAQQGLIQTTSVVAENNPVYSRYSPGSDTEDKVFLLSISEAEKYFKNNEARKCKLTAYAVAQGQEAGLSSTYLTSEGEAWWWLRSPGSSRERAANVNIDGSVYMTGFAAYSSNPFVRPVLWISLN